MKQAFFAYVAGVRNRYILAWLLGVPASLLIIVYVFQHLFR